MRRVFNIDRELKKYKSPIIKKIADDLSWTIKIEPRSFSIKEFYSDSISWDVRFWLKIYPNDPEIVWSAKYLMAYHVRHVYLSEQCKTLLDKCRDRENVSDDELNDFLLNMNFDEDEFKPTDNITLENHYDNPVEVFKIVFLKKDILQDVKNEVNDGVCYFINFVSNPLYCLTKLKSFKEDLRHSLFMKKLKSKVQQLKDTIPPEFRSGCPGNHLFFNEKAMK